MSTPVPCPKCHKPAGTTKAGVLRQHKTDRVRLGTQGGHRARRESCPYGGVTLPEAKQGVTALMKRAGEYAREVLAAPDGR